MNNKVIIKEIEGFIVEGLFEKADMAIHNYIQEIGYDDDIYSMLVVNEIFKGNLIKAADYIKLGLRNNIYNSDLYSNLAYIYDVYKSYDRAFICYNHALKLAKDEDNIITIKESIEELKKKADLKVKPYSIIIVTHNDIDNIPLCIKSIRENIDSRDAEIIVVDNNSIDGTREFLKNEEGIKCIFNDVANGIAASLNKGISIADSENDIFILNSKGILMPNTILNLQLGLYCNDNIGAAASVNKDIMNTDNIITTYDKALEYSLVNNIPNETHHKFKINVGSFSLLIRREVIKKLERFDEYFTIDNTFEEDLSYRILQLNYKLLSCRDSYIGYLKDDDIYDRNLIVRSELDRILSKWGIDEYNSIVRYDLIFLLLKLKIDKGNILQINCGVGATLLELKNINNQYNVFGVEKNNRVMSLNTSYVGKEISDIKESIDEYEEGYFDAVFVEVGMLTESEAREYLAKIVKYVKNEGTIITSFSLDKQRVFNSNDDFIITMDNNKISAILKDAGLSGLHIIPYWEAQNYLKDIFGEYNDRKYRSLSLPNYYTVGNRYTDIDESVLRKFIFMLRRIEFDVSTHESEENIFDLISKEKNSFLYIKIAIERSIYKKDYVLNCLVDKFREKKMYNEALKLLFYQQKNNPKEKNIYCSIEEILRCMGENELADKYYNLSQSV